MIEHPAALFYLCSLQPSWTLYIQVMSYKQAENFKWNPFDLTKVCVCVRVRVLVRVRVYIKIQYKQT